MKRFGTAATSYIAILLVCNCLLSLALAAERGSPGDLYILEYERGRVVQLDAATGANVGVFAQLTYDFKPRPNGIAFGGPNNNLFITPEPLRMVAEFDGVTGEFLRNITIRPESCRPTAVEIGPNGNLFLAFQTCSNQTVDEYDSETGAFVGTFVSGVHGVDKMAFSPAGNLYLVRAHPKLSHYIEVLEVDWRTRTPRPVLAVLSEGERGNLTFGPRGELWLATKYDIAGYNTNDWSSRSIAHFDVPIMTFEAGLGESGLVYVVTDADVVYEVDTSTPATRRLNSNLDGDGDFRLDEWVYLAVKPQPVVRNEPPQANAGPDQTVRPGTRVVLSGAASSDPEGDYQLSYRWDIQQHPVGSNAVIVTPDLVVAEFIPDLVGDYVIALTVTDSQGAYTQDRVLVTTWNAGPTADAGLDIPVVEIGSVVTLNGSGSYDPDGDPLTYQWEWVSRPAGSAAVLLDEVSSTPQFVADVHGDYVVSLVVTDSYGAGSDRDTVAVSFVNVAPVVVANGPQEIVEQDTVTVTALATDANFDPVVFCWRLVSRPASSAATLQYTCYEASGLAHFTVDVPGYFVLEAVANDGFVDSAPESVTIRALSVEEAVLDVLAQLRRVLLSLPERDFGPGNKQQSLVHKVDLAVKAVKAGDRADATDQVEFISKKTDGCFAAKRPDNNDWLRSCAAADTVYPLTVKATALLRRR